MTPARLGAALCVVLAALTAAPTASADEPIRQCAMDVHMPSKIRVWRTEYVDRPELLAPWFSRLTRDDAHHRRQTMFVIDVYDGVSEQMKTQLRDERRKGRIMFMMSSGIANITRRQESEFCPKPN